MDPNAKQLAVERLKNSTNILVTVSVNPQVDDLSALIGFSLLMGKLNKHASAVFSGDVPRAIDFLQPSTRVEKDVSSLRDFIIALDKSKADKLRYKVEDNVVKIFITPYKNRISQDDLSFSEGDFNVDTVVALGVSKRDDLDGAIKAHGRILHDATVITINAGDKSSDLGAVDWQDPTASSLCEMLVSISESFGSGLLDEQISTAFLTGIVAATDRFSNAKTSPKVMTMAAQLMAAGANQQLISNNLQITPKPATPPPPAEPDDSQLSIDHSQPESPGNVDLPAPSPDLVVPPDLPAAEPPSPVTTEPDDSKEKSIKELEEEIAKMAGSAKAKKKTLLPPRPDTGSEDQKTEPAKPRANLISHPQGHGPREVDKDPLMGGTFNATSQQAHDENVSDLKRSVNSTLLNHPGTPLDEDDEPEPDRPEAKAASIQPITINQPPEPNPPPAQPEAVAAADELSVDDARRAVEQAVSSQAFDPAHNPLQSINAQPLPPVDAVDGTEISIDSSGHLEKPGQTTTPPPGDTNQEFKLPS